MSETEYRQLVAQLAAAGHSQRRTKRDIREEIVHRVSTALDDGEPWALEVVQRWQCAGAEADYERAHRELNTTTYIRRDGRRIRKTVSYSRPKRSGEDGSIVAWVQDSFWDYDLPTIINKRSDLAAQGALLMESAAAFDLVIEVMLSHPGCKTAREAWLADGRDLAEIDLNQAV